MTAETDVLNLPGGLHADGSSAVIGCSAIFIVCCTLALLMRFVASRIARRSIFLEDWLMIPAWVMMMVLCGIAIWSVKAGGVGRHEAWVLRFSPKSMKAWAQSLFVTEFLYGLLIPTEKTSILLLYLRLFNVHHWFRYTTYAMIAYIWMWGISESIVAVTQCKPVAYQWNKQLQGTCIDQLAYFRWVSVPNAIHDVAMLILPVPVVWQLQIPGRQRLALLALFLFGSIGCVASFIRMYNFFQLNAFSDRTWASIQLLSWTVAAPGVILICACLPTTWPLLRRISWFRTLVSKSSRGTAGLGSSEPGAPSDPWFLKRLPYVCAIVKEVLRWRPTVPLIPQRVLTEDLEFEGYKFPAGTEFLVNSIAVCSQESLYAEPQRFMPERWLQAPNALEQDLWQFAFSAGRRSCVGYKLAQKLLFLSFARLLYCFDFVPGGDFDDRELNAFRMGEPFPAKAVIRGPKHGKLIA